MYLCGGGEWADTNLGVELDHSYVPSLPADLFGVGVVLCVCALAQAGEIFAQRDFISGSGWNLETPLGLEITLG